MVLPLKYGGTSHIWHTFPRLNRLSKLAPPDKHAHRRLNGEQKVKRISWTIIAALFATLFLPINAAQAATTTEACVSGSAILSYPRPLAIDQSGNLFFVDQNNKVIRKVLRGSRSVVNVTFDDNSVPGQALKNELQSGNGGSLRLGLDATGNLYVAVNYGVKFVFKLTPSGVVSVVAGNGTDGYTGDGGLATSATIHDPSGLAIDASGNIYISDYSENVIRKINVSDGKINTVVGGSATFPQLSQPGPLTFDPSGQLFIATGNGLILKRSVEGNVSVFAGSESDPISAQSIAVDSNGTVTYLINGGREIYQINSSTKAITKIAGGTVSVYPGNSLDHRFGGDWAAGHTIVVDSSGKVYVTDSHQMMIKKIDPSTLTISEYAGVPRWVGNSYLYIPTDGTKAIYANFRVTQGLAASSNGDIYFSSTSPYNTVVKASKSTGLITNIAGDFTGSGGFAEDGAVAAGAKLNNPASVAVDAAGNVYFLDLDNHRLRKIKVTDGKIITIAGTGTSGYSASDVSAASSAIAVGESDKVAVDSLGNIYLTDNTNRVIRKITSGANPTISNIASGLAVITGLSVDSVNNFLYFSTASAIKKINISSSSPTVTSVATLNTHSVRALAIDPVSQTLYYANESPENVRTIGKIMNASTSQTTLLAGPTSLVAGGGSTNYVSAGAPATSVLLGNRIQLAFSSGTSTLYVGHEFSNDDYHSVGGFQSIDVSTGTISTFVGVPLDGPVPLCAEYEVVPTITPGSNGSQAAAIPATASSAVFSSPSILNTTLKFTSTSATASATVTPLSSNPATSAATPFQIKGSTKIVDIQVTGITGPVTVCLDGAPTDSIFHFTGGQWVELPSRTYADGQVCGVTTSFSPFTAAEPPTTVTPVNSAPGAPASVVATATGKRGASVVFSAPSSNGGSAITSYTAISTPGGVTKTLTQAGSGTFNFDGLQPGTSYTFAVTAKNANGTSSATTSSSIKTTAADVASLTSITFTDDGSGTAGKLSWVGKNIDSVLYTGPASSYPGTFNFGAFSSSWNGSIRNLTPATEYTVSIYAISVDGIGESKSLTFKTGVKTDVVKNLAYWNTWLADNTYYKSEAARLYGLLNKFNSLETSALRSFIKVPISLASTVSATSLTPKSCSVVSTTAKVDAGMVKALTKDTCTISYTVSGPSKAPATLVKDFVFKKVG